MLNIFFTYLLTYTRDCIFVMAVFSGTLQLHCKVPLLSYRMLSVCRLSVFCITQVYCDKITADRITRFSLQSREAKGLNCRLSYTISLKTIFEGSDIPSIGGSAYLGMAWDFPKL